MQFTTDIIHDTIVIFRPEARLDLSNSDEFESIMNKLRETYPACNFIVDLSGVEYMSSTGMRVIISAFRKLKEIGLHLVILKPHGICAKLIDVVKLDKLIDVFDSEEEAIRQLKEFEKK